jgi:hypothetical protein
VYSCLLLQLCFYDITKFGCNLKLDKNHFTEINNTKVTSNVYSSYFVVFVVSNFIGSSSLVVMLRLQFVL